MGNKYILAFLMLLVLSGCSISKNNTQNMANVKAENLFRKGIVMPLDYKDQVGDTLKILSWNVEHFIDEHDNPYTNNRRENTGYKMENRVSLLVNALRKADADIVVLQEFEHIQFLKQIANDSLADMNYQFFADHESINWYMNVVVMSRVPLGITYGYGSVNTGLTYIDKDTGEEKYETQSRINTRLWSVDVLVNDSYSFLLTGVHLKAGRGPRNIAMRKGQLQFLKGQFERFINENPKKNILIVGDFNAKPESEEIQYLLDDNSRVKFVNNAQPNDFSHPADEPKRRIDHILPNTNMQKELVPNSLKVNYYFDRQKQRQLSDHLPLTVRFITRDKR